MTTEELIKKYAQELTYNQDNDVFGEDALANNKEDLEAFSKELLNLYKMEFKKNQKKSFQMWWYSIGSGITPEKNEDIEEFAKRVAEASWEVFQNNLSSWLINQFGKVWYDSII